MKKGGTNEFSTVARSEASVLAWLNKLITSRVSADLSLRQIGPNQVDLVSSSDSTSISFPFSPFSFGPMEGEGECTFWDVNDGGGQFVTGHHLVLPFMDRSLPIMEKVGATLTFNYDVFGLIFWCLSRREELKRGEVDAHGRVLAKNSHAFRHNYLSRAIVDEWLDFIRDLASSSFQNISVVEGKYELELTHDVDHLRRYTREGVRELSKNVLEDIWISRSLRPLLDVFRLKAGKSVSPPGLDPYDTFGWLMELARRFDLKTTYYFIAQAGNSPFDAHYRLDDEMVVDLMQQLADSGHAVGLHPSYGSYLDESQIRNERDRLAASLAKAGIDQERIGVRMHYLQYSVPATMRILASLGFDHDASFGYPDHSGFRCGTCFDYEAVDPVTGSELGIKIRPLIAMDCSLLSKKYEGLSTHDAYERLVALMRVCQLHGGKLSILWHNSYFQIPGTRQLLERVLNASRAS